ncbi:MAG TPA: hypothetical protein VJ553_04055 [Candidatus Paceibacterota bacterium]|nr:hypothetical protein [Candidatus Paceibacterota bacterium]
MDKNIFLRDHGWRITLAAFNRDLFLARDNVTVTEECIEVAQLAEAHTPWYYRLAGERLETIDFDGAMNDVGSRAIAVSNSAIIDLFPDHLEKVKQYRADYAVATPKEPLIIAEDRPSGARFIPDGNHTAIALYRNQVAGVKYEPVPAFVIRGTDLDKVFGDMVIAKRT